MEAAHALCGVTMQEPGISSLVSLRLEDKADFIPNGHETRKHPVAA